MHHCQTKMQKTSGAQLSPQAPPHWGREAHPTSILTLLALGVQVPFHL